MTDASQTDATETDETDETDEETLDFTVTFMRSVTVSVPASLVPEGFTMPKRVQNMPGDLVDAILSGVPEMLAQTDPDDFGDLEAIADSEGDVSAN